ncbi:universal stress protein [Virgibacillus halodenitrificans]|uniref:Universal stress protein n=1 Tax=Virgibacillus halodenitrificans TaxID=1482 RepID=A0ABR7VLG4_VIRHA|nr:universal stress protein [Virgibacillus halodenitrificans]MBD1221613.1 universal stress protein [Virgibacillus halodenitrificans]MYL60234.1 universal stress protein [Virgibacillus halodenitrificans]
MSRKILVAYDGSPLSRQAIEEAKQQAAIKQGAEVYVIAVARTSGPNTNVVVSRSIGNELAEHFHPQLEKIKQEFERLDISIFMEVIVGDPNENPGKSICNFAEEQGIDLIIVGSRGLGNVKKIILGSVSNYVVQHSTSPILIMK